MRFTAGGLHFYQYFFTCNPHPSSTSSCMSILKNTHVDDCEESRYLADPKLEGAHVSTNRLKRPFTRQTKAKKANRWYVRSDQKRSILLKVGIPSHYRAIVGQHLLWERITPLECAWQNAKRASFWEKKRVFKESCLDLRWTIRTAKTATVCSPTPLPIRGGRATSPRQRVP